MVRMTLFVPRPYQRLIIKWIIENKRVGVWSFMGSGKTAATLWAIDALQLLDPSPVLVVAPLLVARDVWTGECEKWENLSHLRVSPVLGSPADRRRALKRPADVYTVNFENLPWLIEHYGEEWPFRMVVVDESSKLKGFRGSAQISKNGKTFVRKGGTLRASCLAKLAHTRIERFVELSGTPSSNGLKTLWGPHWFLDAGKALGYTFTAFTERWFRKSFDGFSIEPLPFAEKEIHARVAPTCFSLIASDWFDAREPIVTNVFVDMPPDARKAYRDMEREMYATIREFGVEAVNAGAKRIKCSQLANGAIYTDDNRSHFAQTHDAKIEALERIIEEAVGMPVLVVYGFKHDLARLLKAFPQGKALDKNPATVKAWNAGKIPVMFLHAASAGHGNNFQDGGNIIVYFDVGEDLELYMQVLERIGPARQWQSGYDRPVFVYHLLTRGTVDDIKLKRHETKRSIQDLLLEEMAKRG